MAQIRVCMWTQGRDMKTESRVADIKRKGPLDITLVSEKAVPEISSTNSPSVSQVFSNV